MKYGTKVRIMEGFYEALIGKTVRYSKELGQYQVRFQNSDISPEWFKREELMECYDGPESVWCKCRSNTVHFHSGCQKPIKPKKIEKLEIGKTPRRRGVDSMVLVLVNIQNKINEIIDSR